MPPRSFIHILVAAAVFAVPAASRTLAQTTCITPNCAFGALPTQCQNLAAPRTPTVNMTTIGASFMFDPSNPKIEPGECVTWRALTLTHSSTGNSCTDDMLCGSPAPPACEYDTANVNSGSPTPTSTCFYDPAKFPVGTGQGFFCRIHASATAGAMRGTLRVTSAIVLTVDKDLGTGSVKLSWTGGGVAGDVSYKVAENTVGDAKFPAGTTNTVNPDGGVLGTTLLDVGELSDTNSRYYLVRNKQTNEP